MNEDFTIERVNHGRDYELIYREGDHELRLWMELTGFFQPFDRVAGLEDLNSWTRPAGEPISTEAAATIRARIEDWGTAHATRVGFVATISLEEEWKSLEQKGYRKEVRADGLTVFGPPLPSTRMGRLWRWLWS